MRCPACGNNEVTSDTCPQCHTLLNPDGEDSFGNENFSQPSSPPPAKHPAPKPSASKKPSRPSSPATSKKPSPALPKEGKHRPRPLHDLDLTLPELEVQQFDPPIRPSADFEPVSKPEKHSPTPGNGERENSFSRPPVRSGNPRTQPPPKPGSIQPRRPRPTSSPPPKKQGPEGPSSLDFASYIISISTAALMALGGTKLPGMPSSSGSSPMDISQAKELIDLLAMLDEKTVGNLTTSERELLKQSLANLRQKFLKVTRER